MEGHLFWFSDSQWSQIEPHLPTNQQGPKREDDRRILSGIMHVIKTGCRWCDCPAAYGPAKTVYNRFARWSEPTLVYAMGAVASFWFIGRVLVLLEPLTSAA